MIFKFGVVHADPHPGNVLVNKKGNEVEIVLLDHGLYSKLEESFRVDYCKLWMAILKPDKDKVKELCTKMGVGELFGLFACIVTARSYKSVTEGITHSRPTEAEVCLAPVIMRILCLAKSNQRICCLVDPTDHFCA